MQTQDTSKIHPTPRRDSTGQDLTVSTHHEKVDNLTKRPPIDFKTWDAGFFVHPQGMTLKGIPTETIGKTEEVSDGWACIKTIITKEYNGETKTSFVIVGKAISEDPFEFEISADDFSTPQKLKAALTNHYGKTPLGKMDIDVIKKLTKYERRIKQMDKPQWSNEVIFAPGLVDSVVFDFERKIAIDFRNVGEEKNGTEAIKALLQGFDNSNITLLMATFFGAPAIAKLWPDERFGLFIIGLTGTLKTTAVQILGTLYGQRYIHEANLARWGDGGTTNAISHIAAKAGPFPFVLDNFKTYTDKDAGNLQRMLHAMIEGTEKDRLNKNSELTDSEEFLCTPIITGENYPGQDAATRARIVQIDWIEPKDKDKITEAQKHIKDINAVGKAWCLWLSSDDGREQMRQLEAEFDERRSIYIKAVKDSPNAGRIATNAAVLSLIWDLVGKFPLMEDLADEYEESFKLAIEDHIIGSKRDVAENLDAEKFINWLRSEFLVGNIIATDQPHHDAYTDRPDNIGLCRNGELLIRPAVFQSKLFPAWQKTTNGTRGDTKSMLRQLEARGYLAYDKKNQQYTLNRKINKKDVRVHVFDWAKVIGEAEVKEQLTETQSIQDILDSEDKGDAGKI